MVTGVVVVRRGSHPWRVVANNAARHNVQIVGVIDAVGIKQKRPVGCIHPTPEHMPYLWSANLLLRIKQVVMPAQLYARDVWQLVNRRVGSLVGCFSS